MKRTRKNTKPPMRPAEPESETMKVLKRLKPNVLVSLLIWVMFQQDSQGVRRLLVG